MPGTLPDIQQIIEAMKDLFEPMQLELVEAANDILRDNKDVAGLKDDLFFIGTNAITNFVSKQSRGK